MQDCFVLDNNGYIVFSERQNDTGKFFGEIEGAIMESMVDMGIYKVVPVYDLQALCSEIVEVQSDSNVAINVSYRGLASISLGFNIVTFSYILLSALRTGSLCHKMVNYTSVFIFKPYQHLGARNTM